MFTSKQKQLDDAVSLLKKTLFQSNMKDVEQKISEILGYSVTIQGEDRRKICSGERNAGVILYDRERRPLGSLCLPPDVQNMDMAVELCVMAAQECLRLQAERRCERQVTTLTRLSEEVLQGTVTDRNYIERILSEERFPRKKHIFFVFVETSQGPFQHPDEELLEQIKTIWTIVFPFIFQSNLVLLVCSDVPPMDGNRGERFGELLRSRGLFGSFSKPFSSIDRFLGYHLCRAVCAAKAVARLKLQDHFAEFDAVASTAILFADQMPYGARKCVDPRLLQLIEQDKHNGSEFLRTLTIYWKHCGDRERAAADLNIHRNTLAYRLRRIEELLDCKLADPRVITSLQLSLAQLQCLGEIDELKELV